MYCVRRQWKVNAKYYKFLISNKVRNINQYRNEHNSKYSALAHKNYVPLNQYENLNMYIFFNK